MTSKANSPFELLVMSTEITCIYHTVEGWHCVLAWMPNRISTGALRVMIRSTYSAFFFPAAVNNNMDGGKRPLFYPVRLNAWPSSFFLIFADNGVLLPPPHSSPGHVCPHPPPPIIFFLSFIFSIVLTSGDSLVCVCVCVDLRN